MKNLCLISIALLLLQNIYAQDQALYLSSKTLDTRNVEISYEKSKPGNYRVTPKFTFDGTTCDLIENKKEYTVFNSDKIIMRELSKKELKKYQVSKGNK